MKIVCYVYRKYKFIKICTEADCTRLSLNDVDVCYKENAEIIYMD